MKILSQHFSILISHSLFYFSFISLLFFSSIFPFFSLFFPSFPLLSPSTHVPFSFLFCHSFPIFPTTSSRTFQFHFVKLLFFFSLSLRLQVLLCLIFAAWFYSVFALEEFVWSFLRSVFWRVEQRDEMRGMRNLAWELRTSSDLLNGNLVIALWI